MTLIEIQDDQNYTLKTDEMELGEVVECPDKSSQIEKLPNNECKITFSKKQKLTKIKV